MLEVNQLTGFGVGETATATGNPLAGGLWNPSDKYSANLELSLGNTKAYTTQISAWMGGRADKFVAPGEIGKFELRCVDGIGSYTDSHACGVSTGTAGLYDSGNTLKGDAGHYLIGATSNGYTTNDYLGFKVDRVADTLYVYKNGVSFTTIALPATDNLYPLYQLLGAVAGCTINCEEATFVYAIP